MTSSAAISAPVEQCAYKHSISEITRDMLPIFDNLIYSYLLFNVIFLFVGAVEGILFLFFFTFLMKSALLAFTLAILLMTFFSYCILKIYLQSRKPEQFADLVTHFKEKCRQSIEAPSDMAQAYARFSENLKSRELKLYTIPACLNALRPILEKYSSWCHWEEIYKMREILLQCAIEEHLNLVKQQPTSLSAHASLANAYVMLTELYASTGSREFLSKNSTELLKEKFKKTSSKVVEEFKILHSFAPNDSWVYEQLAYSYRDLKMSKEEIETYEALLKLNPSSSETLFKLGVRYFQQGSNAQGLLIYERLRQIDSSRANDLITYYGRS